MEPVPVYTSDAVQTSSRTTFLAKVYAWMTIGLFLTAVTSTGIEFGLPGVKWFLIDNPFVFYGLLIVELAIVWGLSSIINKIPSVLGMLIFFFYAVLNGVTLCFIFMIYSLGSIFATFFITSAMFAGASVLGFITKMDLSKMGSILIMALIGLIVASIVNIFLNATILEWIISIAGIIIFTGLTAWDTQKIKNWASGVDSDSEDGKKASIMGALMLYLDFINLFLFILRILGRRN